ncbi:MAG: hypothetical protein ACYCYP_06045 [Leptospirales bacterium]
MSNLKAPGDPEGGIPRKGKVKGPEEGKRWFKRLMSARAGVEAIFIHLKTNYRMNVPWAVLSWDTDKSVQTAG